MTVMNDIAAYSVTELAPHQNAFKGIDGTLTLTGPLAEAALSFQYQNSSQQDGLELHLIFPLAVDAVLLGVDLTINGQRLNGRILPMKRAERDYEDAISDGDTPILIEPLPDNHFRMQLGNLKPNEQATVTVRYAQLLTPKSGQLRFVLPTTIAPRYGATAYTSGLPSQPTNDALVAYPIALHVITDPAHITDLACPSARELSGAEKPEANGTKAPLNQGEYQFGGLMNRDFVLTWSAPSKAGHGLLMNTEQPALLVQFELPIAEELREPTQAVTLKVLIDCSGSMAGSSIAAAREGAMHALNQLRDGESFAVSLFGDNIQPLTEGLKAWKKQHRSTWRKVLSGVDADLGGTEMESALKHMLSLDAATQADILLITDGQVSQIKGMLRSLKKAKHRIFAVGVGSAPAESKLAALAEASGGECLLVSPGEDMRTAIDRLMTRMRTLQIHKLKAVLNGVDATWLSRLPRSCPATQTHTLFAHIPTSDWQGQITVSGELNGKRESWELSTPVQPTNSFAARQLTAYQRVKTLPRELQVAFALEQQLLTEDTRLLCIHERIASENAGNLPMLDDIAHMSPMYGEQLAVRDVYHSYAMQKIMSTTNPYQVFLQIGKSRWYHRFFRRKVNTPIDLIEWLNAANNLNDLILRIEAMERKGLPSAFRKILSSGDFESCRKLILGWLSWISNGHAKGVLADLLSHTELASEDATANALNYIKINVDNSTWHDRITDNGL